MNFLATIWLIPLFPLLGAALMLLFGKTLDPQPPSDVAVAPGVEPVFEHGHEHGHGHDHDHGHGHEHVDRPKGLSYKFLIDLICPGMILLAFIFSAGAVWQLSRQAHRVYEVINFTWIAGLPFHMSNGHLATFQMDWAFYWTR